MKTFIIAEAELIIMAILSLLKNLLMRQKDAAQTL